MSVVELERPCALPLRATTCLETVLEAFPGAEVVSEGELDLVRQQAEVEEWNRSLAEEGGEAS